MGEQKSGRERRLSRETVSFQKLKNVFDKQKTKTYGLVLLKLQSHSNVLKLSIERLRVNMESTVDRNGKAKFLKFSHFRFRNALEQIESYSFQDFS